MRRAAYASAAIALSFACARKPPAPPPREPPPRILSVALERVALRTNAYVELHTWLAAAGRDAVPPPPGLDAAADSYRRALAKDDADELLARTTAALSSCTDDRCARLAVERTPFVRAFSRSLATFVARSWTERAALSRTGVEIAREAFSVESEGILRRVATVLRVEWPDEPVAVDVVVDAPPAGREALLPVALPVHGPCFARGDGERMRHARVLDCVLVRALLPLRHRSKLGAELDERGWEVLVIHAVAATVSAWEPKHVSPSWRSAYAVEPKALDWLRKNALAETTLARWPDVWPTLARGATADPPGK